MSHIYNGTLLSHKKEEIKAVCYNKSRDITLPTKVRLVKAMVFPVVMYGCESWSIKKVEYRRIDAFDLLVTEPMICHKMNGGEHSASLCCGSSITNLRTQQLSLGIFMF